MDILGGGIVSSLIKRSKMDDANAYMEQAKRDLARFGKELRDVEDFKDLGIKPTAFSPLPTGSWTALLPILSCRTG